MKVEIVQEIDEQESHGSNELRQVDKVDDFDAMEVESIPPKQKALSSISEQPDEEDKQSVIARRRRLKRKPMPEIDEDEGQFSDDSFDASDFEESRTVRIKFSDIETRVNCNQTRGLFQKVD